MEVLLRENERLKRELEGCGEKAARLQKVRQGVGRGEIGRASFRERV